MSVLNLVLIFFGGVIIAIFLAGVYISMTVQPSFKPNRSVMRGETEAEILIEEEKDKEDEQNVKGKTD